MPQGVDCRPLWSASRQMDPRLLESASQLCQLAGVADLFTYLEVSESASAEAFLEALKKRRRKMQGMQANPKYKDQARFLIKHFAALQDVAKDLPAYRASLEESKRRERAGGGASGDEALKVVELTIRGVLAAGTLTPDQVIYLRNNAADLGITGDAFEDLLKRIAAEMNVKRPAASREVWDEPTRETDEETLPLPLPVPSPSNSTPRRGPGEENTAPPVRHRSGPERVLSETPTAHRQRVEILGAPVRNVIVGRAPVYELVRFRAGVADMSGVRVQTDRPWLLPDRTILESSPKEQALQVEIDPRQLRGSADQGHLRLLPEKGLPVYVRFEVERTVNRVPLYLAGGLAAVLLLLSILVLTRYGSDASADGPLIIEVDPGAEVIELAGQVIGSGRRIEVADPPIGEVMLKARQRNFQEFAQQVRIGPDAPNLIPVRLVLDADMSFVPDARTRRGELDQTRVGSVMGPISAAMNDCLGGRSDLSEDGAVRIHVGRDGVAIGAEFEGSAEKDPVIQQCLKRQAARVVVPPLSDGDYATVRYEYSVDAKDDPS